MTSNIPNQPASSSNPSGQPQPPNQGNMNNGGVANENTPGNPYQASPENQYHAPMVNNPGNPQGNGYATPQNSPYPQASGNFQQQSYPQAPGNFQQQPYPGQPVPNMNGGYPAPGALAQPYPDQKSKMAAGLLGIFLGGLGIHNFYLGYTGKSYRAAANFPAFAGILSDHLGHLGANRRHSNPDRKARYSLVVGCTRSSAFFLG